MLQLAAYVRSAWYPESDWAHNYRYMAELLKGRISDDEGLKEALEIMSTFKEVGFGVLQIKSDTVNGELGVAWGKYITGARVEEPKLSGKKALRKILRLREGKFSFIDTEDQPVVELRQSLGIDLLRAAMVVPELDYPDAHFMFEMGEDPKSDFEPATADEVSESAQADHSELPPEDPTASAHDPGRTELDPQEVPPSSVPEEKPPGILARRAAAKQPTIKTVAEVLSETVHSSEELPLPEPPDPGLPDSATILDRPFAGVTYESVTEEVPAFVPEILDSISAFHGPLLAPEPITARPPEPEPGPQSEEDRAPQEQTPVHPNEPRAHAAEPSMSTPESLMEPAESVAQAPEDSARALETRMQTAQPVAPRAVPANETSDVITEAHPALSAISTLQSPIRPFQPEPVPPPPEIAPILSSSSSPSNPLLTPSVVSGPSLPVDQFVEGTPRVRPPAKDRNALLVISTCSIFFVLSCACTVLFGPKAWAMLTSLLNLH